MVLVPESMQGPTGSPGRGFIKGKVRANVTIDCLKKVLKYRNQKI